jgi:hypothetical protein
MLFGMPRVRACVDKHRFHRRIAETVLHNAKGLPYVLRPHARRLYGDVIFMLLGQLGLSGFLDLTHDSEPSPDC